MLRRGSSPSSSGFKRLLPSPDLSRKNVTRQITEMGLLRRLRPLVRSRCGLLVLILVTCIFAFSLSFLGSSSDLASASESDLLQPHDVAHKIFPWHNGAKPVRKNQDGRLVTEEEDEETETEICLVPRLSLHTDSNKFAYRPLDPLKCSGTPPLFTLDNGILRLNQNILKEEDLDRCEYRGIDWMTDAFFTYTDVLTRKSQFEIKIKHDYMRIECYLKKEKKSNRLGRRLLVDADELPGELPHMFEFEDIGDGGENPSAVVRTLKAVPRTEKQEEKADDDKTKVANKDTAKDEAPLDIMSNYINKQDGADNYYYADDFPDYDQFLTQVVEKEEVLERKRDMRSASAISAGLNVLILAFDSMSHLSYQRKLPKLYKYLKDTLGASILNAYNIVGDATTAAIVPIMTGKAETELPEVRRNKPGSTFVDIYPLLWNKYEHNGYVTMFAEDQPDLGTFNLRYNGFEQIPTDHYMRPFWQAVQESTLKAESIKHCLGKNPQHMYMLNYTKEFMKSYEGIPKFAFTFFGDLTHSDNNPAEYADQDTVNMLEDLRKSGILDKTVLVVMGDHGARYSMVRATLQGKLEERLPMMSLTFPPNFKREHSDNMMRLVTNQNRLTTPFDLHETFLDVLKPERLSERPNAGSRGLSLLREIPMNRTCASAGIPIHWCTCLRWKEVPLDSPNIKKIAILVVDLINSFVHNQMDICNHLVLKSIEDARIVMPNDKLLKFQKSLDGDQRQAKFASDIHVDIQFYQIIIETAPNNASYEATVQHDLTSNKYLVSPDISRINIYGNQADCVTKKYPELRKYCHCKTPLKEKLKETASKVARAIKT